MNDLNIHKSERVRELVEEAGARCHEVLIERLDLAISAVTAQNALVFFDHAGYRLFGQTFQAEPLGVAARLP